MSTTTKPASKEILATQYVAAIKEKQTPQVMTDADATKKWPELKEEFETYGYAIPTNRLLPCIWGVNSFRVNGHQTRSPISYFAKDGPVPVTQFSVRLANGNEVTLPLKDILPFYMTFLDARRIKAAKLQQELNALRDEIQAHEDRYDALHRQQG